MAKIKIKYDLTLMMAVTAIGSNSLMLSPILTDVAVGLGTRPINIGTSITIYNLSTALAALFLAPRTDAIGIYKSLQTALLIFCLGILLSLISLSSGMLIFGQGLAGIGAGFGLPAIYLAASKIAEKGKETVSVGRVLTGWSLAMVLAIPLASFVVAHSNWRIAYAILLVISLLAQLSLNSLKSLASLHHHDLDKVQTARSIGRGILTPFSIPGAKPLLAVNFLYMAAFYGAYSYIGTHLKLTYGVDSTGAGIAVLLYGVGFGVANFANRYLQIFGLARTASLTMLGIGIIYFLLQFRGLPLHVLYIFCLGWGFVNHLGLNAIISSLGDLKCAIPGHLMGMNSLVTYLGGACGTAAFGWVFEMQSYNLAILGSAGALFLSFLILRRTL